jgi:hypothetical protein
MGTTHCLLFTVYCSLFTDLLDAIGGGEDEGVGVGD